MNLKKFNNRKFLKKERQFICLFLFIPLLLLIAFSVLPIINLINYSFTSWNGISSTKDYVLFENYIKILTDPKYIKAFLNNGYYFISGLLQIIIGLYFAIVLTSNVKFKNIFKSIYILPMIISGVAISMIFRLFFEPGGTLDQLLTFLGLEEYIRFWLGDPTLTNKTLAFISLWKNTAMSFVIYYGAIETIPKELFQIAEIEGASFIHKVRFVILPNISLVLKINFILLIIGSISAFEIPMVITNGSNGSSTFLLLTMKTAFENKRVGLASAMAVILTLVTLILVILYNKLTKEEDYECS